MFEALAQWIEGSESLVYVLAPLLTVFVAILPIPAEIPTLLNGMVFGPLWGTLTTWLLRLLVPGSAHCCATGRSGVRAPGRGPVSLCWRWD